MATSPFDSLDPARKKIACQRAAERVRAVRETVPQTLQAILAEVKKRRSIAGLTESVPPIFHKLFAPARNKGAHGGRGSAKSWTFGTMAINRAMQRKGSRIVCVREVQKSLEQSVKRLLEDLIKKHELSSHFTVQNTQIKTPGDGIIIFQGMQDHTAESIKSLEGYDIAWVEEAQSLSQRSLDLLRPTIRKEDSELWFSWNPKNHSDPVDRFLRGTILPPDSVVVEANYRDNPFFPAVLQREMEWDRRRDIDKYNHVWLGGYELHSEARVFKNWRIDTFETPDDAEFLLGGDWGFATDPDVLLRGFTRPGHERTLWLDQEAYQVGCEIDDTPALFDGLACTKDHKHGVLSVEHPEGCEGWAREWEITADSARPETISYMQRHGYPRIVPAVKGPHSIEEGIQFLKSYDIIIHSRCIHTIDEFTHYNYKRHPLTDQVMPVLQDKKNHVIDSARYMVEKHRATGAQVAEVW